MRGPRGFSYNTPAQKATASKDVERRSKTVATISQVQTLYFHCFGVAALAIGPSSHVNGPHNVGKVNSFHERQMRSFSGIFMISESQRTEVVFVP